MEAIMSDVKIDENCDTSNIQPAIIKISKKEKKLADLQLKSREFQVRPLTEIDENCETSNIRLSTTKASGVNGLNGQNMNGNNNSKPGAVKGKIDIQYL